MSPARAPAAAAVDGEGSEDEDVDIAACAYADSLVSYEVIQGEIDALNASSSRSAADDAKLDALETRLALLTAEVSSGALTMGAYLAGLRKAIEADKAACRAAKAKGDSRGALIALRRAKVMANELAEAEAEADV